MKNNLRIYISTFGFKCIETPCGVPIEVGATKRENFLYELRDDTGDNISIENSYYGELTGLYWVWKNAELSNYRYVGYSHYNKRLSISPANAEEYLCRRPSGWIVYEEVSIPAHSDPHEWNILTKIIKEDYSSYFESFQNLYREDGSSDRCNSANMFITSIEELNNYCEFLFSVCEKLREKLGDNKKDRFDRRYCAFFAERLLSVYILANKREKLCVPIKRTTTAKSSFESFIRKIPFSRESKVYGCIRNWYLSRYTNSSYKKNGGINK